MDLLLWAKVFAKLKSDMHSEFNDYVDWWRSAASGGALSKAGLRVATVLPSFVNREFGYAFPTDEQLASEIKADAKTAKRGLAALDKANLIDRVVQSKIGLHGKVTGKSRRIFLCFPTEGTTIAEPKGQTPKGHPYVPIYLTVIPLTKRTALEQARSALTCPYARVIQLVIPVMMIFSIPLTRS